MPALSQTTKAYGKTMGEVVVPDGRQLNITLPHGKQPGLAATESDICAMDTRSGVP